MFNFFKNLFSTNNNQNDDFDNTDINSFIKNHGLENTAKVIVHKLNSRIKDRNMATKIVLEELDAASQGDEYSINFVKHSGFEEYEYRNQMLKIDNNVDEEEVEKIEFYFRKLISPIRSKTIFRDISLSIVDNLMKEWCIGKYRTNDFIEPKRDIVNNDLLSNDIDNMTDIVKTLSYKVNKEEFKTVYAVLNLLLDQVPEQIFCETVFKCFQINIIESKKIDFIIHFFLQSVFSSNIIIGNKFQKIELENIKTNLLAILLNDNNAITHFHDKYCKCLKLFNSQFSDEVIEELNLDAFQRELINLWLAGRLEIPKR